ncbi:LuxR family transcriptional regulator [Cypionkella sp.]|uniref:helix-turn-helix transcriptional regulator n=1 Tax=Cypionkella sp. TaxID=2811411 RepID=UPI00271E78A6|nr:LuxR family transcriptional regulator [Cypionkella sp.]MDO8986346.1 autoinducer binding domain-containing protein [Cypionkella sp.]MDP2050049.1 autoinducer binding domain-containing protein [Cypionkella sp.]
MSMLIRLVPGFAEIDAALRDIAPSGYILALNVRYMSPEFYHVTYPAEWVETYTRRRYVMFDPVVLWSVVGTGTKRWSEFSVAGMKATSLRVLTEARAYGLNFGAMIVARNATADNEKCLISAARPDREFTDDELQTLNEIFQRLLAAVGKHAGLTASERSALQGLAEGLSQEEVANRDGVSKDTIKKRVERARKALGAANATQAVAIAVMKGLVTLNDIEAYRFTSKG